MTITQTVEIPANRRLIIDVPLEVPTGSVIITFTPAKKENLKEHKTQEWINPLFGIAKSKGATLTLNRFMELQQEELSLENKNDQRLWN